MDDDSYGDNCDDDVVVDDVDDYDDADGDSNDDDCDDDDDGYGL